MLGLDAYGSSDDEEEIQPAPFVQVNTLEKAQRESSRSLLMTEIAEELNQRARATGGTG